jgi:hypothetical protein
MFVVFVFVPEVVLAEESALGFRGTCSYMLVGVWG